MSETPSEPWACASTEIMDIRRWYVGVITPVAAPMSPQGPIPSPGTHPSGVERLTSINKEDPAMVPEDLLEAVRSVRRSTAEHNSEGYMQMNERRPFLERTFAKLEPHSVRTCVCSLAATSLGSGALALPYAFSLVGLGLGIVTMTIAGLVSALSLQVLMIGARYTNLKSYAGVLELSGGSAKWSFGLDMVLLLNGIGSVTCCLIFLGDFLPALVLHPPALIGLEGFVFPRDWAVTVSALAVWPLAIQPNLSALRYVSLAVPFVLLFTILIVACDAPELHRSLRANGDRIAAWDFNLRRWLQAVAIMVNAFANHMNAIPCVNQLAKPSIMRIVKSTVYGNSLVWALLCALGAAGYMSWGSAIKGDFLLNYPETWAEIWVCRLMLALLVYFVLPVALFPTARSCAQLMYAAAGHAGDDVGSKAQALSATLVLVSCTIIATRVSDVAAVLSVLGGIFASSLMFLFPAVVFRRLLWPAMPTFFRQYVFLAMVIFGALGWASVAIKFV